MLGAGAMFTLYTYISPVLQHITDATPLFVTSMLVLIGVGFSIGNSPGRQIRRPFRERDAEGLLAAVGGHYAGDPVPGAQ